jgi:2-octaprenyl-6-methoxyphenol hydroxylase
VAALALARQGADVVLIGEAMPAARGRTIALFDGSVRLLADLGIWRELAPKAAPLRKLRIIDDTDNLFRWPELCFDSKEIGLDAFGWNLEAETLSAALRRKTSTTEGIRLIEGLASEARFGEPGSSEPASVAVGTERFEAPLLVAADGQRSPLREAAGLTARFEPLPQSALIAILRHQLPHGDCSTEFHTRGGPCTLVPLALDEAEERGPASDGKDFQHASSLVWMLEREAAEEMRHCDDTSFARQLERRVHSIFGKMRVLGPRATIPLAKLHVPRIVADRLALVGEAAHAFPPIGAQGLNLGLRDAADLAARVGEAIRLGHDIGGSGVLDLYARDRRTDIAMRASAVDIMNRSLLSDFLPIDLARGFGMAALDLVPPLRRFVMRQGIEPGFGRAGHADRHGLRRGSAADAEAARFLRNPFP